MQSEPWVLCCGGEMRWLCSIHEFKACSLQQRKGNMAREGTERLVFSSRNRSSCGQVFKYSKWLVFLAPLKNAQIYCSSPFLRCQVKTKPSKRRTAVWNFLALISLALMAPSCCLLPFRWNKQAVTFSSQLPFPDVSETHLCLPLDEVQCCHCGTGDCTLPLAAGPCAMESMCTRDLCHQCGGNSFERCTRMIWKNMGLLIFRNWKNVNKAI